MQYYNNLTELSKASDKSVNISQMVFTRGIPATKQELKKLLNSF